MPSIVDVDGNILSGDEQDELSGCTKCKGDGCAGCNGKTLHDWLGGGLNAYKGATNAGLANWYNKFQPEDDAFKRSRRKVCARAVDAFRNDCLTQGGVNEMVNLAITDNWRVNPSPDYLTLRWDEKEARQYSREWRRHFERDMKSSARWISHNGKNDFYELLRLELRTVVMQGESYVKFNNIRNPSGPIGFNVEIVHPGRVDSPEAYRDDANVFEGIRKAQSGYEQGYYVFKYHTGSCKTIGDGGQWQYVPAKSRSTSEAQMLHNMVQWTPDLTRGLSMLHAQLIDIKKKNKMKDAGLNDMIAKAEIALVITSNKADIAEIFDIDEGAAGQMQSDVQEYMEHSIDWHKGMGATYAGNPLLRLYDGEKLDGFSPSNSAGNYSEFMSGVNADNARPLGLSNEMYTQQWHQTNFSGARAGILSVKRNIGVTRQQIPARTSQCVWERYLGDAFLSGKFSMPGNPEPAEAFLFYMQNIDAIACATWSGGAWDEIDPAKTGAGYEVRQRLGILTQNDASNELLNRDWDEICDIKFSELDGLNEKLERRGYPKIADPMKFLFPGLDMEQPINQTPVQLNE